ncbi:LOW QUALITY PROTEIN: hypothetical protein V2J09_013916 [Rumex salicifolius]
MDSRLVCLSRSHANLSLHSYPTLRSRLPVTIGKVVKCSMKSYKLSELPLSEVDNLKARPRIDFSSIFKVVQPIVDDVLKFDKVELDRVVEFVADLPDPELDPVVKEAFDVAYDNIYAFHAAQKSTEKSVENMKGVRCKRVARCIGSVGLYVPGGTAVLPSTALMLSIPAKIAGCKTIVLATPPSQDGSICKEVLYCAKKAGVTHILKAGGAQAISAMAWGTSSCPKVEKIFGPGNQYVTAAKMILQNSEAVISIDMPAGPSEVLVIADKHANPVHIAADLLSQAEHGPDSQVVLVVVGDGADIKGIDEEITKQCRSLPRGEIPFIFYLIYISYSSENKFEFYEVHIIEMDDLTKMWNWLMQGHSSRLAALDYTVCLYSEAFVTTQGGNFPHFLMGHRRYMYGGHAKTIIPDKRKLALLFDDPDIRWEAFQHQMQEMLRRSDMKGSETKKDGGLLYTFPMPDCMCKQGEGVKTGNTMKPSWFLAVVTLVVGKMCLTKASNT